MKIVSYHVTLTDSGRWMHSEGSDFLFSYIKEKWDDKIIQKMTKAFEKALQMASLIKDAVKDTSGQEVVDGLYLLNQEAMTKAMNSIEGMGQTSVSSGGNSGNGTAVSINTEFFASVLGGLGGDVSLMKDFLSGKMGEVQAQMKQNHSYKNFGTIIGLVSLMPIYDIPITSFRYAFSSQEVGEWVTKLVCGSATHHDYDYKYTVVTYNYVRPDKGQTECGEEPNQQQQEKDEQKSLEN